MRVAEIPVTDNATYRAQSVNRGVRAGDCGLPTDCFRIADNPGAISRGGSNRDAKWVTSTVSALYGRVMRGTARHGANRFTIPAREGAVTWDAHELSFLVGASGTTSGLFPYTQ